MRICAALTFRADALGIDKERFVNTIKTNNQAIQEGQFNLPILDSKCTKGITPPKSNWALPIDTPPFLGFAVTCGVTFTFGGLKINCRAQVLDKRTYPFLGFMQQGS